MDVNEIMKNFSGENGLAYGVDTAIKALRPGCKYDVAVSGGHFNFTRWWDANEKELSSCPHRQRLTYPLLSFA